MFSVTTGDEVVLQHHDALWFDDGNIVLIAGKTCFKVHRSVLSRYSDVFSDMFSIPQPEKPEFSSNSIDGCPTILLHDAPEELEIFLTILYDGYKYVAFQVLSAPNFISYISQAGTKRGSRLALCQEHALSWFQISSRQIVQHSRATASRGILQ